MLANVRKDAERTVYCLRYRCDLRRDSYGRNVDIRWMAAEAATSHSWETHADKSRLVVDPGFRRRHLFASGGDGLVGCLLLVAESF